MAENIEYPSYNNNIEEHIWHPYSSVTAPSPLFFVEEANGVRIKTSNGELIDGMSSWWAAIHGYNHPELNNAAIKQIEKMSHIMFGGFTHKPAQELTSLLLKILPKNPTGATLSKIFYSDSGSVSVEVALKMAIQYWSAKGLNNKTKFATVMHGYHGDTWHAMSVCDPVNGMHGIFGNSLPINFFASSPQTKFRYKGHNHSGERISTEQETELKNLETISLTKDIKEVENIFKEHHSEIAAFIIEPIVQGAGGMRFYTPEYLIRVKELCTKYNILLIFDEIATGFGRTGKMFALEHTAEYTQDNTYIIPDIITIGKGLTGGYISLAATICTNEIAEVICNGNPGVFMHGPTFMGNPLACAIASASVKILLNDTHCLNKIKQIEEQLTELLTTAKEIPSVSDVRILGAIGVIEMKEPVELKELQPLFVKHGIWLRPFGGLIYTMPPYIMEREDIEKLCKETIAVIKEYRLK